MSAAAAPWSVKGIDPKAREVAKDLARRSGMTLGEWLNTMIMDDEDDGIAPLPRRPHASEMFERRGRSRRLDDTYGAGSHEGSDDTLQRVAASVDAIAARLEAAERRSTVAIQGVDQAVSGLVRRLETQDQQTVGHGRRIDDIAEELREGHRRLRRFEQEVGPGTAETFGKMETAVGALAGRLYDIEERQRSSVNELRQRMDGVEKTHVPGKVEGAMTALASRLYDIEERQRAGTETLRQRLDAVEKAAGSTQSGSAGADLLAQVGTRLDSAQAQTTEALRALGRSFAGLDQRLRTAESRTEPEGVREAAQFEKLAETLARQVDDNRSEMMRRLDTAETEGRMERIERALLTIGDQVKTSEQSSAKAVETMGREVLRIAENLNGRVERFEVDGGAKLDALGLTLTHKVERDMGRYAQAVEQRLTRTDDQHAIALEKLGGEITRISDRLADRIAQSERKSAQALEDIGRRLTDSSDRIEQRYDRASGELAERMRLSEERTTTLLAEARVNIEQRVRTVEPEAPLEAPGLSAQALDLRQPDWRASVFPGEDFGTTQDDGWSSDPMPFDAEPAPFPTMSATRAEAFPSARLSEAAPPPFDVAPQPLAGQAVAGHPFGGRAQSEGFAGPGAFVGFGGADVGDALEATAPTVAPGGFDADQDDFAAETDFVGARALRANMGAGAAAGRTASTRSTIDAARAAMATPAADAPRAGFGLNLKRGGKSRLQERLDKQSNRDGSTVRKALLTSVVAMAVTGGIYATGRLAGGEGFAVPGLDRLGLDFGGAAVAEPVAPQADATLAAVALTPTDAVPLDSAEAVALYDRAVEQIDAGEAGGIETLTRAANLGHAAAQLKLAGLYESGEAGVTRDEAESRLWARRAAESGDPRGMHAFGMYLFDGIGGARNRPKALEWLLKAADRGLVDSQYNAARIYEAGDEGIAPNPTEAFKWYLIAARTGDQQAQTSVDRLTPEAPAAVRRTARAAADRFQVEPLA